MPVHFSFLVFHFSFNSLLLFEFRIFAEKFQKPIHVQENLFCAYLRFL